MSKKENNFEIFQNQLNTSVCGYAGHTNAILWNKNSHEYKKNSNFQMYLNFSIY